MSLLSAAALGVYRDLTAPGQRVAAAGSVAPAGAGPHSSPAEAVAAAGLDAGSLASFGQLLSAQIPSEALLAYTTLLAIFSAAGDGFVAGRWLLYGLSLPACAAVVASAYLVRRGYDLGQEQPGTSRPLAVIRHLPWFPITASVLAMAVYGLVVPGSALEVSLTGPAFAVTAGCLSVGGGLMMSLLAPWLGKGNTARPQVRAPDPDAGGPPDGSLSAPGP